MSIPQQSVAAGVGPAAQPHTGKAAELMHQNDEAEQTAQACHTVVARHQLRRGRQGGHVAGAHHHGECQQHGFGRRRDQQGGDAQHADPILGQ